MKFTFTQNSMSHQCICNKTTTALCAQAVDTSHTCQEISVKTCNLDMYTQHIFWGVEMVFSAFGSKCNHTYYFL